MEQNNIKLTISYDGTNFNGYQSQVCGNTIEDNIKKAVNTITGIKNKVYCAGRTDSGVHAQGQVVSFFTIKKNMNELNWIKALNSLLPFDIRVLNCEFMPADFHSRRSCIAREYKYTIVNSPVISALKSRYSAHYIHPLDVDLLRGYCNILSGEHDFTSFCALGDKSRSKVRLIYKIIVEKKSQTIIFRIIGNAFLQHMIRIIIGTVLKLHRFDKPPDEMNKILLVKDRTKAGPTYSPRGLVFRCAYYVREDLDMRIKGLNNKK